MFRKSRGNLIDCKLRCRHDRPDALPAALFRGPADVEPAGLPNRRQLDAGVLCKTENRGLENRGDRGADDVLAILGEIGVAAGLQAARAAVTVTVKSDL